MGMFDYVWVNCPKCGDEIEFQSKAGPCNLNNYQLHNAPPKVQLDLVGEVGICVGCNGEDSTYIEIQPTALVAAVVRSNRPVEFDPDNDY